ncbi:hypothetical protein HZH66_004603 [Vespula vulgaris]|uniref:Uncharacterized protein n=1 Tax=Vespula vulgaris TaxID=7454 RepID=A0A834K902_VESVU|nr:hypothetical protein HZH66_004603 [Vespula vulgaris]
MGNMAQNCAGERASPVCISQETHSYGNATGSYPTLPFSIEFSPRFPFVNVRKMFIEQYQVIIIIYCEYGQSSDSITEWNQKVGSDSSVQHYNNLAANRAEGIRLANRTCMIGSYSMRNSCNSECDKICSSLGLFGRRDTTPRAVAMYRPNGKIILRRISLLCDFTKHRRREEPQRLWFSLRPRVRFTMEESSFDVRKRTVSADGFFAISFRESQLLKECTKPVSRETPL